MLPPRIPGLPEAITWPSRTERSYTARDGFFERPDLKSLVADKLQPDGALFSLQISMYLHHAQSSSQSSRTCRDSAPPPCFGRCCCFWELSEHTSLTSNSTGHLHDPTDLHTILDMVCARIDDLCAVTRLPPSSTLIVDTMAVLELLIGAYISTMWMRSRSADTRRRHLVYDITSP